MRPPQDRLRGSARPAFLNLNHAGRIRWRSCEPVAIFANGDHKPCGHPFGRKPRSSSRPGLLFLYRHGKWKTFLDLIRGGEKNGYATFVEAAFLQRLRELEDNWRAYLQDTYARRNQIYRLPTSRFFPSRQEFLEFERQSDSRDGGGTR